MFSLFRSFPWHSKFAFPLWTCSVFYVSQFSQALKINIPAADLQCFLCFRAFPDTQNSHFRCGSVMFSVFRSFPWHSKFAFPLRICSVFYVSEFSVVVRPSSVRPYVCRRPSVVARLPSPPHPPEIQSNTIPPSSYDWGMYSFECLGHYFP